VPVRKRFAPVTVSYRELRMMIRDKGRSVFTGCWLLCLFLATPLFAEGYALAPTPQWVSPIAAPKADWVEKAHGTNGEAYLLVDRQWSMLDGRLQSYAHFATKALSASGVEEVSGISIDFDPLYESLTLHKLSVWRNGVETDRLPRSRIDLIQREKELEYRLYDGTRTLNAILEDVRPGDIVEYSYTIDGANPIFDGHFTRRLNVQWATPVGRLHYRLTWPHERPLNILNDKTALSPIQRLAGNEREYIWLKDRVEALVSDSDTPSWYDPFPKIALSDLSSWGEVVEWALPLYQQTLATPAEKALVASMARPGTTKEQQLLEALDFVQEQIRYLGMEMGESSHKPSLPGDVLERRYGDCKDKVRLLVSLLRQMGIEAYPALVNTHSGVYLAETLPTQTAFDHVIALVRLKGRNYWLDPTRTHQQGSLDNLYQPDYDNALVIAERGGGLRRMSDDIQVVHGKRVEETFDIRQSPEQPVVYRIETQVDHYYADAFRRDFAQTNAEALQQSYLNYTARYYPSVEVAQPIQVTELEAENAVKVVEQYRLPREWKPQSGSSYVVMNFEPYLIDDQVSRVDSPKRSAPYAVTHPVRYRHTTRVIVPAGSVFEREYNEINDSAFRFVRSVDFKDGELLIDYLYESLSDHVLPADIEVHAKNLRDLYNLSSYQVRMLDPAIGLGEYHFAVDDVNWLMVGIASLTLMLSLWFSYRFIYRRDPPETPQAPIEGAPVGLSGWLILPAISIFIYPFSVAWSSLELMYIFSAVQWSAVGEDSGTAMLVLIVFEVMMNLVMIVVSLLMIAMFVTRRRGFPGLFIRFYLFVVAVSVVDLLYLHLLSLPGVEVELVDIRELVRLVVFTVIWGSYFARSRRVKATFTRSLKTKQPQRQAEPEPVNTALTPATDSPTG
jgi:transglutaminase-like putative cysteine protease